MKKKRKSTKVQSKRRHRREMDRRKRSPAAKPAEPIPIGIDEEGGVVTNERLKSSRPMTPEETVAQLREIQENDLILPEPGKTVDLSEDEYLKKWGSYPESKREAYDRMAQEASIPIPPEVALELEAARIRMEKGEEPLKTGHPDDWNYSIKVGGSTPDGRSEYVFPDAIARFDKENGNGMDNQEAAGA